MAALQSLKAVFLFCDVRTQKCVITLQGWNASFLKTHCKQDTVGHVQRYVKQEGKERNCNQISCKSASIFRV